MCTVSAAAMDPAVHKATFMHIANRNIVVPKITFTSDSCVLLVALVAVESGFEHKTPCDVLAYDATAAPGVEPKPIASSSAAVKAAPSLPCMTTRKCGCCGRSRDQSPLADVSIG